MLLTPRELEIFIDRALEEDSVGSDVTTWALIPLHLEARASLIPKESGILAGLDVAAAVFKRVNPDLVFTQKLLDGDRVEAGEIVATISGSMASILTAERTALNFLQRMSGIATLTDQYVQAVEGTPASIADTRKTVPGLRLLDKYSVSIGGGRNHRMNLTDGVLIKDNHLAALSGEGVSLGQAIKRARARAPHTVKIEVEVETIDAALAATAAGADIVMLDNMSPTEMRNAVDQIAADCIVEASGNVTLVNVAEIAHSGVDIISVGALTHSVRALDISLDYETNNA
ncbi:MAG: carboxylating nicotinate-nucleotide diphosphorylase [Chloroflexi bacterium]|jgi:nicotinate-nucleotide pyrophosphorylase (carboxylating)|nr:carboxylating nicotinate-nucleotide diphosphorylase [Chloroflexota bacterium]MBT4142046.1 carboxylating nicotinate-nucleotide diphosphorylase [Chloroflexota bacterium]MBT4942388.1 carboxylating nicotinate-nucleotide diphosphorylase [Chloroflexota bacterium]MBT5254080.1 carboxylating nicotinate-nucleotide diphosphorylase [Chloroflexota bacterium]MBT5477179.1 carboxylating nicotinate-nucleotide diphosphorylase [Chloroflexota bacterium]